MAKQGKVDTSIIQSNLRLSYEQRIERNEDALKFIRDLKQARRVSLDNAQSGKASRTTVNHTN